MAVSSTMALQRGSHAHLRTPTARRAVPGKVNPVNVRAGAFRQQAPSWDLAQLLQAQQHNRTCAPRRQSYQAFGRGSRPMPHMGALLHGLGVWGALAAPLLHSPWGAPPNLENQDWARWSAPNAPFPNAPFSGRTLRRFVPVEVQQTETAYTLRAEVPGFAKEDIKVVFDPSTHMLTISGERREAHAAGEASNPVAPQGDDQQASQWDQRLAAAVQDQQQQPAADGQQPSAAGTDQQQQQSEEQQQQQSEQQQQAPRMRPHIVFSRSFPVPQDVDVSQQISAKVENGVLQVTLPKVVAPPKPRAQQIPVL